MSFDPYIPLRILGGLEVVFLCGKQYRFIEVKMSIGD